MRKAISRTVYGDIFPEEFIDQLKLAPDGVETLIIVYEEIIDPQYEFVCGSIASTEDADVVRRLLEAMLKRVKSGEWERKREELET